MSAATNKPEAQPPVPVTAKSGGNNPLAAIPVVASSGVAGMLIGGTFGGLLGASLGGAIGLATGVAATTRKEA